ncbi:MAG: TetR/AcrR family transcriptional regulator [Hyphomicrobiales bacterium]|nr:TetR/AcrR family transcriptional regulator [Hyphomicrobiales bacterium]
MRNPFGSSASRPYHHGNLRQALVDAADQLVAERGLGGLTFAEAAKRVGVTGAAPYRHFSDRQALVDELARQGFSRFTNDLAAAAASTPQPIDAFAAMGRAYLDFARQAPGLYQAMFSARPAAALGDNAHSAFSAGVAAMLAGARLTPRQEEALGLKIWALAHGIASLEAAGFIASPDLATTALLDGAAAIIKDVITTGT